MPIHQNPLKKSAHREAVGPSAKYDLIGAMQFCILVRQGLREHHRLCDVGCGSLRAGRLFIVYLLPDCYFGIEPNDWLVEAGFEYELSAGLLALKRPQFLSNSDFNLAKFATSFDFILAHSIFSHASLDQIRTCLAQVSASLAPDGKFLGTYLQGATDYSGTEWQYPRPVHYKRKTLTTLAEAAGLTIRSLPDPHPTGQSWFLMEPRSARP